MPDSGSDRGRSSTRTLVATILAGTEWTPAETPQDATLTAREARDLAVRLRPVLSKLAQQSRGGRRRDQEWLPAVEQLAVDAQYFASWWLPRLEGKSSQSWPSWSADGYADWVKRLDSQRERTLEMVRGTQPAGRIASVTPLVPRSGRGAEPQEDPEEVDDATAAESVPSTSDAADAKGATEPPRPAEPGQPVIPEPTRSTDLRPPNTPAGSPAPTAAPGPLSPLSTLSAPASPPSAPAPERPRVPRTPPNGPPRPPADGPGRGTGSGAHRGVDGPEPSGTAPGRQPGHRGLISPGGGRAEDDDPSGSGAARAGHRPLDLPGSRDRSGRADRGPATAGSITAAVLASAAAAAAAARDPAHDPASTTGSATGSADLDVLADGVSGPPSSPPTPAQTADVGRMVRYVLAASLFAAGLVLVLYATHKGSPSTDTAGHPVSTSTAPAAGKDTTPGAAGGAVSAPTTDAAQTGTSAPTAAATPAPAGPAATPVATTAPPSTAPKSSAAATQPSTIPPVSTGGGAGTAVTSLAVTSLAADQSGSTTYRVKIHVQTSGTGPVTVTLSVAGSSVASSPGTVGAQIISIPLSGQTSYDTEKILDDHLYCPAPYLGVKVSAPGAASTYKEATSAC